MEIDSANSHLLDSSYSTHLMCLLGVSQATSCSGSSRVADRTPTIEVFMSHRLVLLIPGQPDKPIRREMDDASAGNPVYTIGLHLNLNTGAPPSIRFIICLSQPDLNALCPGSLHLGKILDVAEFAF
jgi:hypothetical protein